MTKRIIINADDFGLSKSVNDAVGDAHVNGVLSSATIMANMPGFDDAVRVAKGIEGLGVGVHLNILRGRPISDSLAVRTLCDRNGFFLGSVARLFLKFLRDAIDCDEVEGEFSAQIGRVIAAGLRPTHVDSEKHLHLFFPKIWEATCRAAERHTIPRVRVVKEKGRLLPLLHGAGYIQRMKARTLSLRSVGFAEVARRHNLRFCDRFFGVAMTGKMTADVYEKVFNLDFDGTMEVMCHPAKDENAAASVGERSRLDECRSTEYRALVDKRTREALKNSGARLISYRDL